MPGRSDPAAGASDHEILLRRHGLISHVALLPDDASPELAARFQADAARVARNLIALSPRRFGVLLDAPDRALSDIAYTLVAEGDSAGPEAGTTPTAGRGRTGDPQQGTAAEEGPSERTGGDPERPARNRDDHDEAGEPEPPHDGADPATAGGLTTGAVGWKPRDKAEADRADVAQAAGSREACAAADMGFEARLDRIEARLDALGVDGLLAAAMPAFDDVLSARLDALEHRLRADAPERVDPFPAERVETFWTGLEQAVRLLHGQVTALGGLAQRLETAPDPVEQGRLDDIESAVALGFEAAGEAREVNQAALGERLASLEGGVAARADDIRSSLAAMAERLDTIERALDARPARGDRDAALVAAIGSMGDGIAALIDERLPIAAPPQAGRDEGSLRDLSEQLSAALESLTRLEASLATLRQTASAAAADGAHSDGLVALEQRIDSLASRLEERGGVLSEGLGTAHRSMKNFWLAAENALGRLDAALDRHGAEAPPADELNGRLDAIEARLAQGAGERAELKLALAELLARAERASGEAGESRSDP